MSTQTKLSLSEQEKITLIDIIRKRCSNAVKNEEENEESLKESWSECLASNNESPHVSQDYSEEWGLWSYSEPCQTTSFIHQNWLEELHDLEKQLLNERIREATAKADLSELLLEREHAEDNKKETDGETDPLRKKNEELGCIASTDILDSPDVTAQAHSKQLRQLLVHLESQLNIPSEHKTQGEKLLDCEMQLLIEKIREAIAKADLAKILLEREHPTENKETDEVSLRKEDKVWKCIASEYIPDSQHTAQFHSKQFRWLWTHLMSHQNNPSKHQWRGEELHILSKQLLKEKIREAIAKADLAKLLLEREHAADTV